MKSEHNLNVNVNEYRFDDLVIDRAQFRVSKAGERLTLTPRAFDVLIYLIENRDRVVEKQELFEAIWKDAFVTDNALMRAIKEIRNVLGDAAGSPRYVQTVHKRGYRFIGALKEAVEGELSIDDGVSSVGEVAGNYVPTTERGAALRERRLWQPVTLLVLVVSAVVFGVVVWSGSGDEMRITSIAVLPFVNESENPDLEYLSDGMTEALIASLSRVPDVSVKARSTVFKFKGTQTPAPDIGNELGVQAVLSGRVVQRGDDLTVFLSLVDTRTENNIWSKQYSRKFASLLTVQSEIARDVASSLGARLSGSEEAQVTRSYTDNVDAYQLYLKGRYHVLTTRNFGAETGVSYFHRAIELDPRFALAYAGLAEAAVGLAFGSERPPNEIFPTAKANALKAIELDPTLVEGHVAAGFTALWFDWDWAAAEGHLKRALELDPDSADAHLAYGILLCSVGRESEGLEALRRAVELDPLNLRNGAVQSQFLNLSGRHDDAVENINKLLELEPNFYLAFPMRAAAYIEKGKFDEAIAEAQRARRMNPIATAPVSLEAFALARSGRAAEARELLRTLISRSESQYVSPQNIALIYAGLGEKEQSLDWLERGLASRDLRMTFLKIDPKWNLLRSEDRFSAIMRTMGFPE
jgi:TolB-like protein/DNA-binding winged helix-turn-helix (wHTH) protein/tetratricopeptide (TPR) repeat protein